MRRDFVANVSHELRTPLTSILGYISALRDSITLPSPASSFVDTIERNAERMNNIVGDLLELSRIEAPGYRPNVSTFSMSGLIDEVRTSFAQMLGARQQSLLVQVPESADQWVADREAMGRILTNLVDNASKYSPDNSVITITSMHEGTDLALAVADAGVGVPEADRPRLFERFYRVDRGRSREMGGTGLGLSIVKHLAESHGGSARYEPNTPSGSRLIVQIPQSLES
jgi:two-component system phosphate regulon sensor histidine kinase PhoR